MCFKAVGVNLSAPLTGDDTRIIKKARLILANPGRHLNSELVCFLLIFPRCTTKRFKNSFVSLAVGLLPPVSCVNHVCCWCVLLVYLCVLLLPVQQIAPQSSTKPNQTRWFSSLPLHKHETLYSVQQRK